MPITNQKSTQVANRDKNPPVQNKPYDIGGKVRIVKFDFTQSGVGDIGSTADLCKIPAGTGLIIKTLSRLKWSAFGVSRTLSIGHTGFTKSNGTTVAAAPDVIETSRDVSAAGQSFLGVGANAAPSEFIEYDSQDEITIRAIVAGGTIPDGATLTGWIAYVPTY